MAETFAALILAHALADFVFQNRYMAMGKRAPVPLVLHGAVVLGTAAAATGSLSPWLLVLALVHLSIDLIKAVSGAKGFLPFMLDQAAHLVTLAALAVFVPELWQAGLWSGLPMLPGLMALAAGAILATRAGGFAIGFLMEPWAEHTPAGLPGAGRAIGNLERGLIFLLILTGQAQGIGFLIAAKSVLRFGAISNEKAASEYVIIGTLASFSWAIAAAQATLALMGVLPALGILPLMP